jgi:hypothetical protein
MTARKNASGLAVYQEWIVASIKMSIFAMLERAKTRAGKAQGA